MAHKKAAGTAKNLRDSAGQRLGIKLFGGQTAKNGNIICRQRGTKWRPGEGVGMGVDHTIYALCDGIVTFQEKKRVRYDGRTYTYSYINVFSEAELSKRTKAATKEAKPVKAVAPKKKAVAKKKTA